MQSKGHQLVGSRKGTQAVGSASFPPILCCLLCYVQSKLRSTQLRPQDAPRTSNLLLAGSKAVATSWPCEGSVATCCSRLRNKGCRDRPSWPKKGCHVPCFSTGCKFIALHTKELFYLRSAQHVRALLFRMHKQENSHLGHRHAKDAVPNLKSLLCR